MASTGIMVLRNSLLLPFSSSKCCKNQIFPLKTSQFLSSNSLSVLKKQQIRHPSVHVKQLKFQKLPIISAAQSNLFKAILTIWKVGKDGVEAGTSLVPDAVPRPLARISVTAVAVTSVLFVLKSFISTAFFALAVMGLCYFTFIALNKDEAPKGSGGETTSVDDSLEEARKIMEKYK
ncbi:transmembrane protein [Perilla frutescens var. frutescens]|nr:transmembrane protein [Perilla frutescens var. frutescens]